MINKFFKTKVTKKSLKEYAIEKLLFNVKEYKSEIENPVPCPVMRSHLREQLWYWSNEIEKLK